MNTRILVISLIALSLFSCAANKNVPRFSELHNDGFGADIQLYLTNEEVRRGELLAVDDNSVTYINEKVHVQRVPISDIENWDLVVADASKVSNRLWIANSLVLGQGALLVFSLPINLAVSAAITASMYSNSHLKGQGKDISKAKAFARFPQGIPQGVKSGDLRMRQGARYY